MKLPELTRCVTAQGNGSTVAFQFEGADGNRHEIRFGVSALRSLAPLMLNVLQSAADGSDVGQPAVLTSVRGGYMDDGTPLLGLGLNGIEVVVCFRIPGSLDDLANCIGEHLSFGDASVTH